MSSSSKPLLTFAVAALNQQQFIREAVEAAFAQTYSPLEIILSDDFSEDSTFDIMRGMAAAYRGPHKIVLNQNPKRRCIGGHINRILEISSGELILAAAGDDISFPERAQAAWEAWEHSGRRATSIHSRIVQIDERGEPMEAIFKLAEDVQGRRFIPQSAEIPQYVRTLEPLIFGCAHAFSRKLFETFGNLPEAVVHEDNALGLRSLIAGHLLFINEPLVKYRVHGSNVYINKGGAAPNLEGLKREQQRVRRGFLNREIMYRGFILDLEQAAKKNLLPSEVVAVSVAEARQRQKKTELCRRFLDAGLPGKLWTAIGLAGTGLTKEEIKVLARQVIPPRLRLFKQWFGAASRAFFG